MKKCLTLVFALTVVQSVIGDEITSFTEPCRDIDVAAPEMGTIDQIEVKEGDRVSAGQILARLNEDVLHASLKMAKAGMDSQGRLNSALGELRMQTTRLNKILNLRSRDHASQQEVDRTQAQKEIAEAQVQAVEDDLRIKAVEFERILAQLELRRLKSPIDGIVTFVNKDVGEFVSATDPVVVRVVQLDPLLAVFSVPMTAAENLTAGESTQLLIGENENAQTGVIEFVSPTSDAQSGTTRVKVRIPNPEGILKSGASCRLLLDGYDEQLTREEDKDFTTRSVSKQHRIVPKPRKQK